MRVLVVDDRRALANLIGEGLRDAGFAVAVVYDGAAATETEATGPIRQWSAGNWL